MHTAKLFPLCCTLFILVFAANATAQSFLLHHDAQAKTVEFGNETMTVALDYNQKANIASLVVNGQQVIQGNAGIYSKIGMKTAVYSTLNLLSQPTLQITRNRIRLLGITYGDQNLTVTENWTFTIHHDHIRWDTDRTLSKAVLAEKVGFPVLQFKNMGIWEGAYQDYGGLAWFYLFNKKLDTYGVHSSASRFWNSKTGNGLTLDISAPGHQVALDYCRTANDQLACTVGLSQMEIRPRFDTITQRRRFVRDTTDVWAPIPLKAGKHTQSIRLSGFNFQAQYGRGHLKGINQEQVSGVLNTIARIGVIDQQHFGGNSWHTPYGPICLHEQYIAQMGLAINDPAYLTGYQQCLDFYRENAIKPDGRVWPRWAYTNEDAMPQGFTDKGFYEAQWGYLLDSNPDYVTNVAELYDQTGDLTWVRTHQKSCEKALEWIMRRDSNGNGLVEMITDSHRQKRGSDWIDIIWAAYENAFVNAKLYHALVLWADIEQQLGNTAKTQEYRGFAEKMKHHFNLPTTQGGFWDAKNQCYVHWRDKDGSIHGTNMVIPVNFMAIAYGICDDPARTKTILDAIEVQMQRESLFFWPICLYSYAAGEGNDWQFPFPNYENGDIFLSWGAVGVKAYAAYNPEIALKYVKNVLAQYARDGLAFQRYGRAKQDGLGDDILSGNSLSVVGLYEAIYGIQPRYNRFYLNPHITPALAGTQVRYQYRRQALTIDLEPGQYTVSDGRCSIRAKTDFGFSGTDRTLSYFYGSASQPALTVSTQPGRPLTLEVQHWGRDSMRWTLGSKAGAANKMTCQVQGLEPGRVYTVSVDQKVVKRVKCDEKGVVRFVCMGGGLVEVIPA